MVMIRRTGALKSAFLGLLLALVAIGAGCQLLKQLYPIGIAVVGSGSVSPADGAVFREGAVVELKATPDAGWIFQKWSGSVTGTANPTSYVMRKSARVTATFTTTGHFVHLTINGQGSVTPSNGQLVADGANVTFTAMPSPGHYFAGWGGALSGRSNPVVCKATSDLAVTATFLPIPFSISVQSPTPDEWVYADSYVWALASPALGCDPPSTIDFYLDEGAAPVAHITAPPYRWMWPATEGSQGYHTIKVVATDASGYSATCSSRLLYRPYWVMATYQAFGGMTNSDNVVLWIRHLRPDGTRELAAATCTANGEPLTESPSHETYAGGLRQAVLPGETISVSVAPVGGAPFTIETQAPARFESFTASQLSDWKLGEGDGTLKLKWTVVGQPEFDSFSVLMWALSGADYQSTLYTSGSTAIPQAPRLTDLEYSIPHSAYAATGMAPIYHLGIMGQRTVGVGYSRTAGGHSPVGFDLQSMPGIGIEIRP